MIEDASFMSGVCCGVILGAGALLLIVSLVLESAQRKDDRALRRMRKLWEE